MMHIHAAVVVSVHFIATVRAPEEFTPLQLDAFAILVGEPLPLLATSRAILGCSMWVDLDGHGALRVRFLFRVLIDLAAQVVRPLAVHAPRSAFTLRFDLAQALEEQHTAGILRTHVGNAARHLVGRFLIHVIDMPPELLIAVLAFDRLAREPLLFRETPQVSVAVSIQAPIRDEHRFENPTMLSDGDDGQIAYVEVDSHGHQVWIMLALHDLFGFDLFGLREV